MSEHKKGQFSGSLGYILAAAGSAVGLGNIWRFPYLAAKHGGGMFVLTYILMAATFGFAMIITETALGRKTGKSPVGAYAHFGNKRWLKVGGWCNAVIPMLILPYYSVIGGWVVRYLAEYIAGHGALLADNAYFGSFVSNSLAVEISFLVFITATFLIVLGGVKHGVETASRIMMPLLVILALITAVYSVTRPGALEGVKYFLVPNFSNFTIRTFVEAMSQMFYSLSLAMGILFTYGSYLKRDVDIAKSTVRVEFFDTAIAILAGLMIIPAVFAFNGGDPDTLAAGPSLMFVMIPKVFQSMGMGTFIGSAFFLMVLFAALTSTVSLLETSVSSLSEELKVSRNKSVLIMYIVCVVLGTCSALGFGVWDHILLFGLSILDFFDFLTNSLMMPIAALFTCFLIYKVAGVDTVIDEVEITGEFRQKKMYSTMIKYVCPAFLLIIFVNSLMVLIA